MKLHFFVICLFCALCANEALSQVVFQSSQQRWEVTSVESNDNLTAIFCDITILNNQSGCFDAHEYDKKVPLSTFPESSVRIIYYNLLLKEITNRGIATKVLCIGTTIAAIAREKSLMPSSISQGFLQVCKQ